MISNMCQAHAPNLVNPIFRGDAARERINKFGNVQKCLHGDISTDRISMSK